MPRDHFQRSCGDVSLEASGYVATVDFEYPPGPADPEAGREMAASAVGDLLRWIADTRPATRINEGLAEAAGRRAFALAYTARPDLFSGRGQAALARELGVTRQGFSKLCRQVHEEYGFLRSPAFRPGRRT